MRLGIFGAGYSGRAIARRFADEGVPAWGTTRSRENYKALEIAGLLPVTFDGGSDDVELRKQLAQTTHLIVSIAPPRSETGQTVDSRTDPVLNSLEDEMLGTVAPHLQWICYLSTVGVYGNHDGAWIDEETPVAPVSERSRQRVRAEAEWLMAGEGIGVPVAVLRLSGIYGPGRNALVNADAGKSRRLVKPGQVFNRIHVGDIAEASWLAGNRRAGGIFNITDDEPAPPQDVVTFAHEVLGKEPPPELDFAAADLTPMARSFYGENKRVSNAKSKRDLDLSYAWPNYRAALKRMFEQDAWRSRDS